MRAEKAWCSMQFFSHPSMLPREEMLLMNQLANQVTLKKTLKQFNH